MKTFCLLLSALASAVAYKTATELRIEGEKLWFSGKIDEWDALFADGAVVELNYPPEFQHFPYTGRNVRGQDGFNLAKLAQAWGEWSENLDVKFNNYQLEQGDNLAMTDMSVVNRDKVTGDRWFSKTIYKLETKDGEIIRATWDMYHHEKVDAATLGMKAFGIFGSYDGKMDFAQFLQPFFDLIDEEKFVLIASTSPHVDYSGSYHGKLGFLEIAAKQSELLDHTGDYGEHKGDLRLVGQSPDGKTATIEVKMPYTVKATGAKYLDTFSAVFAVNDAGKIVRYEWQVDSSQPINAKALFDQFMARMATPELLKNLLEDGFAFVQGGAQKPREDAKAHYAPFMAPGADFYTLTFDNWLKLLPGVGEKFDQVGTEVTVLSQDDGHLVMRFDATTKHKETGVTYFISQDQTWTTNKERTKFVRDDVRYRKFEIVEEKEKEKEL